MQAHPVTKKHQINSGTFVACSHWWHFLATTLHVCPGACNFFNGLVWPDCSLKTHERRRGVLRVPCPKCGAEQSMVVTEEEIYSDSVWRKKVQVLQSNLPAKPVVQYVQYVHHCTTMHHFSGASPPFSSDSVGKSEITWQIEGKQSWLWATCIFPIGVFQCFHLWRREDDDAKQGLQGSPTGPSFIRPSMKLQADDSIIDGYMMLHVRFCRLNPCIYCSLLESPFSWLHPEVWHVESPVLVVTSPWDFRCSIHYVYMFVGCIMLHHHFCERNSHCCWSRAASITVFM